MTEETKQQIEKLTSEIKKIRLLDQEEAMKKLKSGHTYEYFYTKECYVSKREEYHQCYAKVKENDGKTIICDFIEVITDTTGSYFGNIFERDKKFNYGQRTFPEFGLIAPEGFFEISDDLFYLKKCCIQGEPLPEKIKLNEVENSIGKIVEGYEMAVNNFITAKLTDAELCDAACESYDKTLKGGPNENIFTSCRYILGYKDGYNAAFEKLTEKLNIKGPQLK
jgi:hypothetical protein